MWIIIFPLRNIAEPLKSTIFAASIGMYDLRIYDVRYIYDLQIYDVRYIYDLQIYDVRFIYDCVRMYDL